MGKSFKVKAAVGTANVKRCSHQDGEDSLLGIMCWQIMGKSLKVKAAAGTANVKRCSHQDREDPLLGIMCRQIMGKSLKVKAAVGTANVKRCSHQENVGVEGEEWWQRTSSITSSSCKPIPLPFSPSPHLFTITRTRSRFFLESFMSGVRHPLWVTYEPRPAFDAALPGMPGSFPKT
jgi:hypothetical protein